VRQNCDFPLFHISLFSSFSSLYFCTSCAIFVINKINNISLYLRNDTRYDQSHTDSKTNRKCDLSNGATDAITVVPEVIEISKAHAIS